jgi:NAD(P)H dehydrogenase (quinone)
VDLLLNEGVPVRAMVHTDDERAEALRKKGAEVVVGDLTVLSDVHKAIGM